MLSLNMAREGLDVFEKISLSEKKFPKTYYTVCNIIDLTYHIIAIVTTRSLRYKVM